MGQTFILIKPDGVLIGLAGRIISKFHKKGFTLKGLKMITVDRPFAEKHYQDMFAKHCFGALVGYIISGPLVAMIWEGPNVVSTGIEIIRKVIPRASDLDRDIGSNLIHGSDSLESAYKEAALWFPDGPVNGPDVAIPNACDIGRISVTGLDTIEQTLILIMPEGVQTCLVGQIIPGFDMEGFTLKGLKMINVDRPFAEKHYQDLSAKPFFSDLVNYISSGPVVAMIWEGTNVVLAGREIIRMTIPCNDMDIDVGCNLIHGSDSVESANKEIALWFPDGPVKLPSVVAKKKARDIGRIIVTEFDCDRKHIKRALREHYGSCGKITDVYVHKKSGVAIIYLVGEDAVDKALKLNESEVNGGWKFCAKAYPFRDYMPFLITVEGYATSLDADYLDRALRELFSSCGEVKRVCILKGFTVVTIKGFDAAEKAVQLGGCVIGRRKVLVKVLSQPPRYTIHDRRRRFSKLPR